MSFIDIPLRTVRFHGPMIQLFGREFKYRAMTVPKAIDAMKNLLPGFERYMLEAHKRGLTFLFSSVNAMSGRMSWSSPKGRKIFTLFPS